MEDLTKATPADLLVSPTYYEALASRSNDAEADHKLTMRQYREREEALHAQLHPAIWQLVIGLVEQRDRINDQWTRVLMAEVCRHLPGIAPAIEVVWEHIEENRPSNIGYCCAADRQSHSRRGDDRVRLGAARPVESVRRPAGTGLQRDAHDSSRADQRP